MNILYTVNGGYVPQLAAGICSVCENNKQVDDLSFYVLTVDVSVENKELIRGFVQRYGRSIFFIDIDGFMETLGFELDTGGWNEIILARLLMARLLPGDVERVLYLDADTIVRKSLHELWVSSFPKRGILSMVVEPTASKGRRSDLGIKDYPYYNSGVLLVDLSRWRKAKAERRILEYCAEKGDSLVASDQDAINVVLRDEIEPIPPQYNASNVFMYYPFEFLHELMPAFSDINAYKEAKSDPVIVHFLGEERPWRKGNTHPFREDYYRYLSKTPFSETPLEGGWGLYFMAWRLFNLATKSFPSARYRIIDGLIPCFLKIRSRLQ